MTWAVLAGVAAGLIIGLAAGLSFDRMAGRSASGVWRSWRSASGSGTQRPAGTATGPAESAGVGRDAGRPVEASGPGRPESDERAAGLPNLGSRAIGSLRAGVVVLDADDVPVLVNPAARAMGLLRTGGTPGSIAAHPLIRTLAGQVRRTGVRREIELDLPRGRDSAGPDPLGVHLRAMGLGGGHVAVEAADVTESHRVARVRRDFVANVSHELKTPIGALQLLAEALLDATSPPAVGASAAEVPAVGASAAEVPAGGIPAAEVPAGGIPAAEVPAATDPAEDMAAARRFAERIQHESIRLGRLVQELLELTRLQGAEPQPEPEPVAVDWVVAEVMDRTRTAAAARRIEVRVEGEPDLTVYGSDNQLATAVANLVDNAIAYSGAATEITLSTRRDDEFVEIAVTDQGIGIAPTDVERIFERFYRADQARSRATGGTGLGLAIVKHIASNHGGRVAVSSTLGGGSTFTLRLPARPPDDLLRMLPSAGIEAGPAERRQPDRTERNPC